MTQKATYHLEKDAHGKAFIKSLHSGVIATHYDNAYPALPYEIAEILCEDLNEINLPPFEERLSFLPEKPERLVEMSNELLSSTGYIFVTPEYNGGISSSLKNFIDTFGRPEFAGKPIAVASVSSGALGGIRAAMSLQQLILAIQAFPQPQMLNVADVEEQLNNEGEIINPSFEKNLDSIVSSFLHLSL
jgi:NAD(P)H-dependent FMN reductase